MRSLRRPTRQWAPVAKMLSSSCAQLRSLIRESSNALHLAPKAQMACFLLRFFLFACWEPDDIGRRRPRR